MENQKVVIFQSIDEEYAFPISYVVSIEKMQHITKIPNMPSVMKGVTKIRGELIPVLDMSAILFRKTINETEQTRIIVIQTDDLSVGFIVDDAREILDFSGDSIKQLSIVAYRKVEYFTGVASHGDRLITIIDPKRMFESLEGIQVIKDHIKQQDM